MARAKIPMIGKRYGRLVVLAEAGDRWYGTQSARLVRVRCDCGAEYDASAYHLRAGRAQQCRPCGKKVSASKNRARSTRLPSGRTLVEIAQASGVSLNTVTQRWLRGWSEEHMGLPVNGKFGRRQARRAA